jgi:hypothetical protein
MKPRFLIFFIVLTLIGATTIAQVPKGFNYQAIARDASQNILANTSMGIRLDIQTSLTGGTLIYQETFSTVTSSTNGLITLVVGTGTQTGGTALSFATIDWNQTLFLKTSIKYPIGAGSYTAMGTSQIWSVPYALIADKANGVNSGTKLSVISTNDAGTDALFEVKRADGQTVFAVYPNAVNVYVPKSTFKGVKGGFAVGGYDGSKAGAPGTIQDYLRVTPDSVRIYVDPNPTATGKGVKGGFAVGGYDESKGINSMYFNLTPNSSVQTVASSPQVLWYPTKNAFLAGNIHIGHVDSVGMYSTSLGYQSIAMGKYSQAFGYKTKALGDYSTAIGKNSVAGARSGDRITSTASNSFALGNGTKATGDDSYAFGSGAQATGTKSFAFGSVGLDDSGNPTSQQTTASGDYSTAIGMGARATVKGAMALGIGSLASGTYSSNLGYYSTTSGSYSGAFGYKSTAAGTQSLALGTTSNASGSQSLAMGFNSYATSTAAYSVAIGDSAKTQANYAVALGYYAKAKGLSSFAIGYNAQTTASGSYAGALGYSAKASGSNSMAIGNATQATNSNALALGYGSVASGTNSTAMGYQSSSQGDKSVAIGSFYSYSYYVPIITLGKGDSGSGSKGSIDIFLPVRPITPISTLLRSFSRQNIAQGQYSVAIGNGNLAANGGLVFGSNSNALNFGAVALGTSASANEANSGALGYNTSARGIYSMAIGNNVKAVSYGEIALGQWNDTLSSGTKDTWNENEYLLTVGNGVNDANRSNALTIYKNGSTILRGRFANSTFNLKYTRLFYNPITHIFSSKDYVYGVYTNLSRDDTSIEYYYSGYFTSSGASGIYYGLFADKLTSPDANFTGTITSTGAYNTIVGGTYRYLAVDNTGLVGYVSSSARYKTDIESLSDVSWLYNLRPVTYRYKTADTKTLHSGLIAEEVLDINPDIVSLNDKGQPETVVYQDLITPLLKAVQDQKKTIDELKSENSDLKNRLEKLESVISNQKQ